MNETVMYMIALCLVWPAGYIATRILKNET